MGAISGLLGTAGGAGGTGFNQATIPGIVNPTNQNQVTGAYNANQQALAAQQQLLWTLQNQNGLQNQSQVYGQLQNIAAGQGPNPAQAMLNQATGQNVANQAALMAGQRGAGANVGLIGRQAAQQGAQTQQQAVGQGATLEAQQRMNAINSAGALANQQAGQQIGATQALTGANQAEQQQLLGAQQAYNQQLVGGQASVNAANAGLANTTMGGQQGLIGGLLNAAGPAAKALTAPAAAGAAAGGMVHMADGGQAPSGPQSRFGQFLDDLSKQNQPDQSTPFPSSGPQALQRGMQNFATNMAQAFRPSPQKPSSIMTVGGAADVNDQPSNEPRMMNAASGGQVPAVLSPGEKYLSPRAVKEVERGANPMKVGETVPGKPKVGGARNSYANDTVKKNLDEGGIVVPRSATKAKNPERSSADFVHKVLAKRGR